MDKLYVLIDDYNSGFFPSSLELISLIAILSGIFVIISRNPIISVLFLISLFLSISIYLIIIGLNFIGISYLLVYIGAVSILFLFILMLIDIRVSELHTNNNNSFFLAIIVSIIFYNIIIKLIPVYYNHKILGNINNIFNQEDNLLYVASNTWDGFLNDYYDIVSIGNLLYTSFSIWLIITSLILLLAMVGAIIINIKNKPNLE
jgi:NADH-ubiquinone oxidoreductase chain 6